MRHFIVYTAMLTSYLQAGILFGVMLGSDGTFLNDTSINNNHEAIWINGITKRVFLGYMISGMGLFRLPIAVEGSVDDFTQTLGRANTEIEANYQLNRQWALVVKPGIHLGDGFVYLLASIEHAHLNDNIKAHDIRHSQNVTLFPYAHFGIGLSFLVAPQTEFMAEVRLSQHLSRKIDGLARGKPQLLSNELSEFSIYNTQLMLGIGYDF